MARYTTRKQSGTLALGRSIWAYAFTTDSHEKDMLLRQEPVLGEITEGKYGSLYFTPYRKDGNGLASSRAVKLESRHYADTLEEAIDGYNAEVKAQIEWHRQCIGDLEKQMLEPKNQETKA